MAQEIEKIDPSKTPAKTINLGQNNIIDLDGLSEAEVAELKKQYAANMIELQRKASEVKIDVSALGGTLETINDQATKATEAGVANTVTHRQKTSIGETEIVIGNTQRAAQGKLSLSASGLTKRLPLLIGIIAVALIVIAFIAMRH